MICHTARMLVGTAHTPYDHELTYWHREIARLVGSYAPRGGRVADVGCGVGHILAETRRHRPDLDLVGIDFDPTCLEIASQRVEGIETHVYDLNEADAPLPATADLIVVSHVLEHVHAPVDAMRVVLDALPESGKAIVAVPNAVTIPMVWRHVRRRGVISEGHVCAWDRLHWMNFLENILGLKVIEHAQDIVRVAPMELRQRAKGPVTRLELALRRVLPWYTSTHIAVVAKR